MSKCVTPFPLPTNNYEMHVDEEREKSTQGEGKENRREKERKKERRREGWRKKEVRRIEGKRREGRRR